VHFDFGACLREAALGGVCAAGLSAEQTAAVRDALARGALLEDAQFPIAQRLLTGFLSARAVGGRDWVVLNGLPRHAGQARMIEVVLAVRLVVHLRCAAEVVAQRIRLDSGGDRAGRADDSEREVRRKLAIFEDRTLPLLDHYAAKGVAILPLPVAVDSTAEGQRMELERKWTGTSDAAR
jgi:adenylate kinase family enzyme